MKLKFTHAALGSALPAVAAATGGVDSDADVALADRVASSYREERAGIDAHRRVKQLHADAEEGAAKEGAGTDVGVLDASKGRRRTNSIGIFGRFDGTSPAESRGLLGLRPSRRALQGEEYADESSCARPDTCEPNLCECVSAGGRGFECAAELHAVCQGVPSPDAPDGVAWTIEGCVAYPEYYKNTYCPFAECIHNGGTYETCDCAFYGDWCDLYGGDANYGNLAKQAQYCSVANCCQDKTDDAGRLTCLAKAPSEMPSVAPSGPTPAPTTGSPTITPKPTLEAVAVANPGTPGSIADGTSDRAPGAPGATEDPDCRKNFVGECETSGASGAAAGNAVTAACVAASMAWSMLG